MGKKLIIVESPAKIKTLEKFLGSGYTFASSVGHIRDLPKKGFGIDVEDFTPEYENLAEKKEVIAKLKKKAKASDLVYLAPDPDREGEAIAWHIAEILPKGVPYKRVTFNAITRDAVNEALQHPRDIDLSLVNAQQARRLLDRIVGYKISPILTRRVQGSRDGGLSAGRVQSVALKLVVEREKEIDAFVPVEYWNLAVQLDPEKEGIPFWGNLYSVGGVRVDKEKVEGKEIFTIPDKKTADELVTKLEKATYTVSRVEKKERKRNPVPPFITSTLQQEASRHYGFSAQRTMSIAQGLYEGVDSEGLITYMRTDSVRIEPVAINAARNFIKKEHGKEYLPEKGRQFTGKKSAQDAHEAIRPTDVNQTPESLRNSLSPDQYKLYLLIWRRFLASQMMPAIYDTVSCDISTDQDMVLRTTGSIIKFLGFLAAYEEKEDYAESKPADGKDARLPNLKVGQKLQRKKVTSEQAFTRPPPRFTEASLVKELESMGVGRPSTYAAIMSKIQSRDYTTKEKSTLKPTELGKVIAQMLVANFEVIMDIGFTAAMEDELEKVAENERDWKELLKEFWTHFIPSVEIAEKEAFVPKEETDIDCPKCGKKLQKIWSRRKYFYGCSGYPDCDFTTPIEALNFNKEDYAPNFDWDQACPKCESEMALRFGKFGPFLGCTNYPDCKGIVNIPSKDDIPPEEMPTCPAKGCDGKMVARRSRFGKTFYSCSTYPDCDVIGNDLDKLDEKYPDHPKTPYVRKKKATKKKSATKKKAAKKKTATKRKQPEKTLSPELSAIAGKKKLSRPDAVKAVWEYIKKHNLQDENDKRTIVPDDKLGKVVGKKPINMMKLSGLLSPHLA